MFGNKEPLSTQIHRFQCSERHYCYYNGPRKKNPVISNDRDDDDRREWKRYSQMLEWNQKVGYDHQSHSAISFMLLLSLPFILIEFESEIWEGSSEPNPQILDLEYFSFFLVLLALPSSSKIDHENLYVNEIIFF